jgi:hypothetical protein
MWPAATQPLGFDYNLCRITEFTRAGATLSAGESNACAAASRPDGAADRSIPELNTGGLSIY